MKLYTGRLSLFARKVEVALLEKGTRLRTRGGAVQPDNGLYSPRHPDVMAANPKGQIPVFVDGDLLLFDSTVIVEYLEDAYPDPPLYPRDPVERARCRLLELYADEIMLVSLRALMHRNTPGERDPERWAANEVKAKDAVAEMDRQFADLARKLEGRDFFFGTCGAADIAVFMMVFYAQRLGGPALDDHPALGGWYRRLLERPAFAEVTSGILAADAEMSAPVAGAFGGGRWKP